MVKVYFLKQIYLDNTFDFTYTIHKTSKTNTETSTLTSDYSTDSITMWSTTTSTNMEDPDKIAVFMNDEKVPAFFLDRNNQNHISLLTKLEPGIISIGVNPEDFKQLREKSEKIVVKNQCVKKTPIDPTPAKMNISHVCKYNSEQKYVQRPKVCYICKNISEEKSDQSEHYTQECNFLIKIKNPEAKMNMIDNLSLCRTCLARHRGQCRNSKKKCDCCGHSGHHRMLCPTNLPGTGNEVKNDKIQVPPKRHRKRKPSISSSSSSSIASSNSTNYFELTARIFKEAKGKKIQNGLESSSKETTPTTTDSETSEDFEKEQKESSQDEVNGDDTYSDFDNVEEGSKDISRSDEASSSGKGDDSDPDKNTDSD